MSGIEAIVGDDAEFDEMAKQENPDGQEAEAQEEEQPQERQQVLEKDTQADAQPEAEETEQPKESAKESEKPESVPLAKFLEEKNRAKDAERQQGELQERLDRMEQMLQGLQPQEQQPNIDEDPYRYLDTKVGATNEQLKQLQETLQQTTQEQQAQQFSQRVEQMEQQFASQTPDYWNAMEFAFNKHNELMAASGFGEDAAKQSFAQWQAGIIQNAINAGQNPAQAAYQTAQILGYQPQAQEQEQSAEEPQQAQAPAPKEQPESLKKLARSQQNAQTLANRSGKTQKDEVDPETVNSLSDREFDKMFVGKDGDEEFRKLFE